jgi:uncharacterized membrane protein
MQPDSKADAQVRADRIALFWQELERLEREGVAELKPAQRGAIRQHHEGLLDDFAARFDIDRSARAHQLSLGMRIASFLGALALAASVYFLFLQFWGLLGTTVQVTALVGAALGSLALTVFIASRDSTGYFTKLAALVAFACFVLNIAMLGQIFNITPSDKALLPWAAFALLLAYRCELRLLLVAGLICLAVFIAARAGTWGGMYWLHFGERPENFFPAALLSFCLPLWISQRRYPGFAQTYRVFGLLILLLPVLVLANWGQTSYLRWSSGSIEVLYQIAGFALSAGAIWLGVRRGWTDTVNTGVVFFVLFLYTKFYDWWWDWMPKWLFFFVLALAAVLLLLVFKRLRTAMAVRSGEARA